MDDQIAKLPKWAQEYIKRLRVANEPANADATAARKEAAKLWEHNRTLQDRIDAMVQMFQCAAKGENEVAKAVLRIVEDYIQTDDVE